MKRLMLVFLLMTISLFGASFDCDKATTKVEKMICQDEELSKLDKKLSEVYTSFYLLTKEIKTDQRAWVKQRNQCQDTNCIKELYQVRIKELNTSLSDQNTLLQDLMQAQQEAHNIYAKTKDVYRPIEILRKAGIDTIVEHKPEGLNPEHYSSILFDYATYLYDTADDTHRHINHKTVQDVLIQAKKYTFNDTSMQLLLARSYLRHFKFAVRTHLGWGVNHYPNDESWEWTIPSAMKHAYVDYVNMCQTQTIQPQLSDEEWLIVKRQRFFIEYHSTFSKEQPKYGVVSEPYKKGFETICKEYVAQLNQMPDDEYLQCSRYAVGNNASFNIEPIITEDWRKQINFHLVHYKNEEFLDSYWYLELKGANNQGLFNVSIEHTCFYQYVDFNLSRQKRGNGESECYKPEKHFFKNQDTNTSNTKDNK
ncbi:MAG: hypothetical protein H6Q35_1050 [Proteobacteria bacterium]|nr:hypothetical protein [Pseudomonadota bacterium]